MWVVHMQLRLQQRRRDDIASGGAVSAACAAIPPRVTGRAALPLPH